ncbi:protein of unknown function [Pseudomonas inefficax]|uniref:Uncharacterized protein n=1 Tax=Pseudomonas inefficax TaxID=2078786 RepID=A0AAQ1P4G8_9PSED|nr:protein of unknown function [Pseudomonas inefficax]
MPATPWVTVYCAAFRPDASGLISKQATPVVPRGLLFFDAPKGAQAKRLDDECTGWRDHGLQVRLVHP